MMNRKYLMMAALAVGLAGPMAAHAQQAAPDQSMPDQTSPQQAAPQQAAPEQAAPEQAAPMPNSQDPSTAPQAYGNAPDSMVNPATQAGSPASATVGASDNNAAAPASASGLTTATDASGVQVISNGPIPDTRANRAKYGRPLSQAGRMTKPAGN